MIRPRKGERYFGQETFRRPGSGPRATRAAYSPAAPPSATRSHATLQCDLFSRDIEAIRLRGIVAVPHVRKIPVLQEFMRVCAEAKAQIYQLGAMLGPHGCVRATA